MGTGMGDACGVCGRFLVLLVRVGFGVGDEAGFVSGWRKMGLGNGLSFSYSSVFGGSS